MVNELNVPRMKDLIPILIKYVESRQREKLNGSKPSSRISLQGLHKYYGMPLMGSKHRAMSDANLLASILERMTSDLKLSISDLLGKSFKASDLLMNSKPSSRISLQGLHEYYGMPLMGSKHRAMSDVNLLASILERITSDLKLSISYLLGKSFKASDLLMNSKPSS